MPDSTAPISAFQARPTIMLGGQENPRLTELLSAFCVHERAGGLSSLELRISNVASLNGGGAQLAFDAGGDLALGAQLRVGAGDASAPTEIFRGVVSALEGRFDRGKPPELCVLAEDALQKARMQRKTRVFENMSIAEIARQIASDLGLTARVTGLEQNFGTQVQMSESDLGFLRKLLARVDADLQVVENDLQVAPRAEVQRGRQSLELGGALLSARVLADLAHQVTSLHSHGWDEKQGDGVSADGRDQALGPGAGRKGGDELPNALASRAHHVGEIMLGSDAEARAAADALRNQRARRFVTVHAIASGNPALRVGTHVELRGLGRWFSNAYYVTEARHIYDLEEGYRTELTAECAYLGSA
jgi:uncharacterized protein